jgi:hypothetical protein
MEKSTKKVYGGIDVGKDGSIAYLHEDGSIFMAEAIPKVKGSANEVDYKKAYEYLITPFRFSYEIARIGVEDVHSLGGMSAKSNFSFGFIKGVKIGWLEILEGDYQVPYTLVKPKVWQRGVWRPSDIEENPDTGRRDPKATSFTAASRLWPDEDFRKSKRAQNPHDGIIDALLIAEFIRRNERKSA